MSNEQIQNTPQLQWSKSQLELLRQCKENLEKTEQEVKQLATQACNVAVLRSEINSLKNKLSEFDSSLFIVTTIGMLKAGKSTLVNLLARSNFASPTGFGFDTTLRPVLITQADDDRGVIQIWFQSDGDKSSVENSLDEVFAVIRKTRMNTAKAHPAEYPLNPANLKNALCRKNQEAAGNMLPKEPLLVVVKVPPVADALLSDKIAILDTPGLDSGISEWSQDKDNCYRWILRRSDLILFLQSSVAPLNETAAAILKEIRQSDRSAPVWLVHNVMEAKHWLKKETMEQEILTQREMANAIFKKNVGGDFSGFQSNLGKAHSALLKPEEISGIQAQTLLQESCFESLESSIKSSLNSSSGKIRKQNCCKQALESVSCISNAWTTLLEELHEKRSLKQTEKNNISGMLSAFQEGKSEENITIFNHFVREKINIDTSLWCGRESWERKLADKVNAYTEDKKNYTADEINEIITGIAAEFCSEIHEKANSLRPANITLNNSGDGKSSSDITLKLHTLFDKYIQMLAAGDASGGLAKFAHSYQKNLPPFCETLELALPSSLSGLQFAEAEKKLKILWEIKKDSAETRKRITSSLKEPLITFYKECDEKLHAAVLRWLNKTALSHLLNDFGEALEADAQTRCRKLEKDLSELEKNIADAIEIREENFRKIKENLERINQENE